MLRRCLTIVDRCFKAKSNDIIMVRQINLGIIKTNDANNHVDCVTNETKTEGRNLPSHADVVVIGGGVVGASTAYHLAKRGVDVVLLERHK